MRLLFLFFSIFLFANESNISTQNNDLYIDNIITTEINNSSESNITSNHEENESDYKEGDIVEINDFYEPINDKLNIAIILDKKRFYKYIPALLNSLNAYLLQKNCKYNIKLVDFNDSIDNVLETLDIKYQYIFLYTTNPDDIKNLENYTHYFFIPTLNKNDIKFQTSPNIYFGGLNFKQQINLLNQHIDGYTNIIYENFRLSKHITNLIDEELLQPHKLYSYSPNFEYDGNLTDAYLYLNTKVENTAQILSNLTFNKISPKLILSTQLNYNPLLFSLVNNYELSNFIITNSIINIFPKLEDTNLNLNTAINYNWLNYSSSLLLNKAYKLKNNEFDYFLNDFDLYIYHNQVQYKTKLYKIYKNGFVKIEN